VCQHLWGPLLYAISMRYAIGRMRKPTNSAIAAGIATTEPNAVSWQAFDALPRAVREIAWGAPVSINPLHIEALVRSDGAGAIAALSGAIEAEVARFDQQHRARHGYSLATVAAGVKPLRYAARPLSKSRRHRPLSTGEMRHPRNLSAVPEVSVWAQES
jgi:hypothetical protein